MAQPEINVGHFHHRPTYNVVGLLTDKSQIPAISSGLRSAGVDVTAVEILCGKQGTRILDANGRYHGLRGRVVRTLQRPGPGSPGSRRVARCGYRAGWYCEPCAFRRDSTHS